MSQNMPRTDLRVRRTHKALRDALIDLIIAKGFNAISVRDLTERAMVNRATFYRHYHDKDDLLERTIAGILDELTSTPTPRDAGEPSATEALRAWIHVLEHVAGHATLYRTMLGPRGSPAFAALVRDYLERLLRQRLLAAGREQRSSGIPDDVTVAFAASAFLGTIDRWLEAGMPYPPAQMAGWLAQLFVLGPYRAAGGSAPAT